MDDIVTTTKPTKPIPPNRRRKHRSVFDFDVENDNFDIENGVFDIENGAFDIENGVFRRRKRRFEKDFLINVWG